MSTRTKKKPPPARKPAQDTKRAHPTKRTKRTRRTTTTRPSLAGFEKIAFTMFHVVDATRARAFYEGVLGFTRGLASNDGTWTEYDLPGGGCLALFRHPDPSSRAPPGGAAVAFEVSDLDALNARLRAAGVVYRGEIVHGPHCRMSNILDSEGNAIVLHELADKRRR